MSRAVLPLLLLLLLLGAFPPVRVQAQATLCMVCKVFRKGRCLDGLGNCTLEEGSECRTRDMYYFNVRDGFYYNHTILDCSDSCRAWMLFRGNLRVSIFCCKNRQFCNRYHGRIVNKFAT